MKDFATALIVTAPSPDTSGTSLVIETGKGVRMPAVPFKATASPVGQLPTLDNAEKVIVTNITGDTLTIVRAQGGTTAQAITGSGAWRLSNTIFAEDMDLSGLVPKTTTINAKPLSGDISLTSSDIGAAASLHTHTAADTTDFDTEVSNNTDVAANTAARHTHANSAVLNATTASFTTADETKLDGIAAGAQVNTVTSVNTRTGAVTGLAEASDLTAHTGNTSNPHSVTKAQVGLGNVANLAPADMPVSTAQAAADATKVSKSGDTLTGNLATVNVRPDVNNLRELGTASLNYNRGYFKMATIGGTDYITGTGFPNGVVTAPVGSIYIDTAVTNGASSWIKKSGTGNTGWSVLEGDTGARNITSIAVGTPVFSGGVWVRRTNNVVTVSISDFESTWATAGTWLEIIPAATMAGFKPTTPSGENSNTLLGSGFARMQTLTTGTLRVYSNTAATLRMHNTVSYITADAWPATLPGTAV
jgi:hypothetical protein